MLEITDANGPTALKKGKYILMFYTDWCPRCAGVLLMLTELEEKYGDKLTFAKIDFDNNPEAREYFGFPGVPAILTIEDGTVTNVWVGISDLRICIEAAEELLCDKYFV